MRSSFLLHGRRGLFLGTASLPLQANLFCLHRFDTYYNSKHHKKSVQSLNFLVYFSIFLLAGIRKTIFIILYLAF